MKALSIRQPYASLVAHGIKDVENRSWETNYRGIVLIHAARVVPKEADLEALKRKHKLKTLPEMHFGAIVGAFDLEHLELEDDPKSKWYEFPAAAWMISRPIVFPRPVPCVGNTGLFVPPASVLAACAKFLNRRN